MEVFLVSDHPAAQSLAKKLSGEKQGGQIIELTEAEMRAFKSKDHYQSLWINEPGAAEPAPPGRSDSLHAVNIVLVNMLADIEKVAILAKSEGGAQDALEEITGIAGSRRDIFRAWLRGAFDKKSGKG